MINRPSESGTLYQLHTMSNRKDLQQLNYFTITHNWHCCYIMTCKSRFIILHRTKNKRKDNWPTGRPALTSLTPHVHVHASRGTHTPHSLPFLNHPVTLHIDYTQINGKKWLSITTSYQTHISKSTGKSVSVLRWISQRARSAVV